MSPILEGERWVAKALEMQRRGLLPKLANVFDDLAVEHDEDCPFLTGTGPCGGPCDPTIRLKHSGAPISARNGGRR